MTTAERELKAMEETVRWTHDEIGLTYDQIGAVLHVSDRTLRRWRGRAHTPRTRQRQRFEDLRELRHVLREVFPDLRDQAEWLHSPSPMMRGRTPISYLRTGHVSDVVAALATLESGAFL